MKKYENVNFSKQGRGNRSRRRSRHRLIGIGLLVCCFMLLLIIAFLGQINLRYTKEQPELFPISDMNEDGTYAHSGSAGKAKNNPNEAAWNLILVNKWNYIPDDYEVELTELSNGVSIDKRIYPALQDMFNAAQSDNIYPIAASGYRTAKEQQRLMNDKTAAYKAEGYSSKEAKAKAQAWVAIPGTSEHQLGISVDINADGINSAGNEVYEWLAENASKFGFICRYPFDKTEITGVINEPWHYRYVGVEAALEIQAQGVCLEEYLNKVEC